ncbi:MAG: hypothetical protein ACREAE_09055 [Nitrosopumilaceae archaeon]
MDPIEYCDACFFRGMPNLCETYKGTFTKISSIHFTQQNKIDRILNGLNARPKLVNRRWTCILDKSNRKNFLDSLWGVGVTVHTLEDHVKILSKLYKPEVRKLGELSEIELSPHESWEEFDPYARTWKALVVTGKKFVAKVKLGTVLKSTDLETEKYFRTISSDGKPMLIPMEKRAAYNIIVTQFESAKAFWQTDKKNQLGFIKTEYLENLPDEIFTTLLRLKSGEKMTGFLCFDEEDYELVKTVLASAKIDLERSTETIDVVVDEKTEPSIISLDKIEKERIDAFTAMITDLGGKIEQDDDQINITGKVDSVKLSFIQRGKSNQEGKMISVSLSALEDPHRITELLAMLRKRLGLSPMSIENLVCRYWPILKDSDLQYTVQSLIEYWKIDKNLALSVIHDQKKFDKVNEWNNSIKTGKIRSNLDTITLGKILKSRQ